MHRAKIQVGFRFLPVSPVVIGGRPGFLFPTQQRHPAVVHSDKHIRTNPFGQSRARPEFSEEFHSRTHSEIIPSIQDRRVFLFVSLGLNTSSPFQACSGSSSVASGSVGRLAKLAR